MRRRILFIALFCCLPAWGAFAQTRTLLSHLADGQFEQGSFRTTFITFNNTNAIVSVAIALTDDNGSPLTRTITGIGTGSTFNFELAPGATRFLQTNGAGALVQGAAVVTTSSPIGVSAVFTNFNAAGNFVAEAGVTGSTLLQDFVLPVDSTGQSNTGIALFSPQGPAAVTLTLFNTAGQQVGTTSVNLNANGHIARFVSGAGQLFPGVSNFQGALAVQSTAPVAAMVLRQHDPPLLSYTSLPVVARSAGKLSLNLAHVPNCINEDDRFRTSFLLFNVSATPANVTLSLTRQDGSPFPLTIQNDFTLAPNGSAFVQTDGAGALAVGAANISSNVPIGASAIFTVVNQENEFQTEAGVGDSPVLTQFTLPVDVTGPADTGIAFFNPADAPATITLRQLDGNGVVLNTATPFTLGPRQQTARFSTQFFPGTANFRGSIAVSSTANIAAIVLRQNSGGRLSYTTLPVASGISNGSVSPGPSAPLLSRIRTGVTATSNVTINEVLPAGLRLSGTVTGGGTLVDVFAQSGSNFFSAVLDPISRSYVIVVPPGTYTLKACYAPDNGVFLTHNAGSVSVLSDTTQNIVIASTPLFTVSGRVQALDTLPRSTQEGSIIVFTATDGRTEGVFQLASNGSYQGRLPSGTYYASLSLEPEPEGILDVQFADYFNIGFLTVSGTPVNLDFIAPQTARLTGTLARSSNPPGPFSFVIAEDTSVPANIGDDCAFPPNTSLDSTDSSGGFRLVLTSNRTYDVRGIVPLLQGADVLGAVVFPAGLNSVAIGGDASVNLNIPALPATVVISGRVTDPNGQPVARAVVSAFSESLTNASGVSFNGEATADLSGNYSLTVLSGTNYELFFEPPNAAGLLPDVSSAPAVMKSSGTWTLPGPLGKAVRRVLRKAGCYCE